MQHALYSGASGRRAQPRAVDLGGNLCLPVGECRAGPRLAGVLFGREAALQLRFGLTLLIRALLGLGRLLCLALLLGARLRLTLLFGLALRGERGCLRRALLGGALLGRGGVRLLALGLA